MSLNVWQSIFVGALQGATEFLPVSSSGHLVVVPALLGWPRASLTYDVAVHIATSLAVLLYFRRDWVRLITGGWRGLRRGAPWRDEDGALLCTILLANVPAGIVGVLFKDWFEAQFSAPRTVSMLLIVNAVILVAAEQLARARRAAPIDDEHRVGVRRALTIGMAQVVAILPGISRSGSTIAAGLATGVRRETAARFSFLMAAPIIVAAGLVQAVDVLGDPVARAGVEPVGVVVVGVVAAFAVGMGAIGGLLWVVRRAPLYGFAGWCAVVGGAGLWLL